MEEEIFKRKRQKQEKKSAVEIFGKCPECGDGDIVLHKSKKYFVCTRRLFDGSCPQTFDRDRLGDFGIRPISKKLMAYLLDDRMIYSYKLLHPNTGDPLNCLSQIYLIRRISNRTGEWKYTPYVKIFWDVKRR